MHNFRKKSKVKYASSSAEKDVPSRVENEIRYVSRYFKETKILFDPESKYMARWDIICIVALFYTALVTPYEVALLETTINTLFFVNRIVDLIFVKDMYINFYLPYWEQNAVEENGLWVKDLRKIRGRYLRGWFWIDLVSILPFDALAFISTGSKDGEGTDFSQLKIFKVIRVLRLLKMARVLKASRIFKRLENAITLTFAMQSLIKFMCMILIGGHWMACIWVLVGYSTDPEVNWVAAFLEGEPAGGQGGGHFDVYTAGLHFAIMTVTSIGYGDITPQNTSEQWACVFLMLLGSATWAYVIGNASGIVATMDEDGTTYHQTMDALNLFLRDQKYPPDLCRKMRAYFRAVRQLMKTRRQRQLVERMSPALRDDVAYRGAHWVKKVPWAQQSSHLFVSTLAQSMDGAVYSPGEIMPSVNHLCLVNRGVASKNGRILVRGGCYGMDIILNSTFLKQKTPSRALTFTELLYLRRGPFLALLDDFPEDKKIVRLYALHLAMRRALILINVFAKCGWRFCAEGTKIPFIAAETLNESIGQKYERFVWGLHPELMASLSAEERGRDIHALSRAAEKQEREEGDIASLLGYTAAAGAAPAEGAAAAGRAAREEVNKVKAFVENMDIQVQCYNRAMDELIKQLQGGDNNSGMNDWDSDYQHTYHDDDIGGAKERNLQGSTVLHINQAGATRYAKLESFAGKSNRKEEEQRQRGVIFVGDENPQEGQAEKSKCPDRCSSDETPSCSEGDRASGGAGPSSPRWAAAGAGLPATPTGAAAAAGGRGAGGGGAAEAAGRAAAAGGKQLRGSYLAAAAAARGSASGGSKEMVWSSRSGAKRSNLMIGSSSPALSNQMDLVRDRSSPTDTSVPPTPELGNGVGEGSRLPAHLAHQGSLRDGRDSNL